MSDGRKGQDPPERRLPAPRHRPILPTPAPQQASPPGDYENFCKGIKELLGVDLSLYKRKQMERRARGLASRNRAATLTEYLQMLRADQELLDKFVERMTITVSQLWRNTDIFAAIQQELLPELAEQSPGARLRLWSVGCSYGAEPYTLAAICLEIEERLGRLPQIRGTDINPRMIEQARRGHFSDEDARDAPKQLLMKYFERQQSGGWTARPELKSLITFKVDDLFGGSGDEVDMILFRNVAIHFERERRDQAHAILARSLRPGGLLVLGSTEMIVHPGEIGLERVRPFVFRRVEDDVVTSESQL